MCKLNFHYIFSSNIFHFTSQRSKQTRQDIQSNNVTKIIVYVNKIKHSTIKAAKKKKKKGHKKKKEKNYISEKSSSSSSSTSSSSCKKPVFSADRRRATNACSENRRPRLPFPVFFRTTIFL